MNVNERGTNDSSSPTTYFAFGFAKKVQNPPLRIIYYILILCKNARDFLRIFLCIFFCLVKITICITYSQYKNAGNIKKLSRRLLLKSLTKPIFSNIINKHLYLFATFFGVIPKLVKGRPC